MGQTAPDANTSQWSVAVLDIGFACVSASVQGTGQGGAEQGQQNFLVQQLPEHLDTGYGGIFGSRGCVR